MLQIDAHSSDPDAKRHLILSPSKSATLGCKYIEYEQYKLSYILLYLTTEFSMKMSYLISNVNENTRYCCNFRNSNGLRVKVRKILYDCTILFLMNWFAAILNMKYMNENLDMMFLREDLLFLLKTAKISSAYEFAWSI